jgi:exonuclease SbcC
MKLQQLTIHNIASFEDAVIDFEKAPLNDADVFLITGITGSGKSTILDAICMALYGKTPRIEESDNTTVINRHEGLTLTDPRRFLRRNTGEGFVVLRFQASGINFEARWGVKRARNKATGALQKREWTLTDLDKKHTLTYETEIKERISELVGLDYDQFCRTTMLSQGEFDKFLKSKENEKAEILQKITGADIYQRIGCGIFEKTREHKVAYDLSKSKLDQVQVLSDEEIANLNQQIADLAKQVEDIASQINQHSANRTWLTKKTELAKKADELNQQLKDAIAETETDDFRAAKADIAQYDATGEARTSFRKINEQQKAIEQANKRIATLHDKYAALLGDCAQLNLSIKSLSQQLADANANLTAEEPRKKTYESAGEICSMLNNATTAAGKAKEYEVAQKRLADEIFKAKAEIEKLNQDYIKSQNNIKQQEKSIDNAQKQIDNANVAELRRKKDANQTAIHNIDNAVNAIKLYKANLKTVDDINEAIKNNDAEKATQTLNLATAKGSLVAQKQALDIAEATRKRQQAAAGDSAEALRNGLKQGDVCPVCGQLIIDELPMAEALKQVLAAADDAYNKANEAYIKSIADVQLCESKIKSAIDAIDKSNAQLKNAQAVVEKSLSEVIDACKLVDIEYKDVQLTTAELQELKVKFESELKTLEDEIAKVDSLQNELNKQKSDLDTLKSTNDNLYESINDKQLKLTESNAVADKMVALEKAQLELVSSAHSQALTLLDGSPEWENNPIENSAAFIKELNAKKSAYTKLVERIDSLNKDLTNKTTLAENANKAAARVAESVPEWSDIEPANATGANDIVEELNSLSANVKAASDSIVNATELSNTAQTELAIFYDEHTDINSEQLQRLAAFTDNEVQQLRKTIADLDKNVSTRRGALSQVLDEVEMHKLQCPQALLEQPEITAEQLTENINGLEQSREKIAHESGVIAEKLNANNKALEQRQDDIVACQKAEEIYLKWKMLNDMLGDSEGKKFRTIALSYVLNSLIRSANVYMSRLTDRYTLSVQPGTFIILVTDAYQGYTTRTSNTISGGETFLVSLALALALSDLGTVSGIDTLFIDEGFGTLSGEPLQKAIETLRMLNSHNRRRVGIISHVAELRERIPVQIQVTQSDRTAASTIKVVP